MPRSLLIKTDLFRFVTFRGPEQIDHQSRDIRFVTHPNIASSKANSCPVLTNDPSVFVNYANTYPSFVSLTLLKAINSAFFDFAMSAHKKKLVFSEIEVQVGRNFSNKPLTSKSCPIYFTRTIGQINAIGLV
jgi:hypothetical protein